MIDGVYKDEDGYYKDVSQPADGILDPVIPVDKDGDGDADKYVDPDEVIDGVYKDEDGYYKDVSDPEDGILDPVIPVDKNGDGSIDEYVPKKDADEDGIYENGEGKEVYIPTGKDDNDDLTYTEAEKNAADETYTNSESGKVYKPGEDGLFHAYAATPVIAPESGSFSSSQRVTISTSTVGAAIYYTTDGSDPSATNGKLYEDEFSISKTTTIKAIAVKDGVNASEIVEATFTKASSETGGDDDDDVVIRPTYYDIIIDESANGGVTSKHSSATAGTTVTLTVEPGEGYELRKLTVTDKDGRITVVSAKGDGSYTFKMPNRDVYVKASFVKDGTSSAHICPSEAFRDVNTNLWYHEAIDFVLENGYMNGMGNGMFAPASRLNRAMIVQVLYKMEGQPEVDTVYGFTDVAPDAWYADAVNWAAENEIVNGYGDTFGPLDPITREQMVTILYRYAEYKGLDTGARQDLSIFRDGGKVSSWASDAVEWAVAVGLISTEGKGNGFFEPAGTATRAEVAQVLMNYCTKILNN